MSDKITLGDIDLDSPFEIPEPPTVSDISPLGDIETLWKESSGQEEEAAEITEEVKEVAEPPVVEEPQEQEDPIYVTAMSLVEKGLLKEDQVSKDIDYLSIRDLIVQNVVDQVDASYNVDERVNSVAESMGFTKQNREYLEYLISGGSEHNVMGAAKYDRLLSLATDTDDDSSERNIKTKLTAYFEEKGVDKELIEDQIEAAYNRGMVPQMISRADDYFKSKKNALIAEDQKRIEAQREERRRVEQEKADGIRNVVRSGKAGNLEIPKERIPQFERDVFAATENVVIDINGRKQNMKVSKLQKMLYDAENDPIKAAEVYYNLLYGKELKEVEVEKSLSERDMQLMQFANRERKDTKPNKIEKTTYPAQNKKVLGTLNF